MSRISLSASARKIAFVLALVPPILIIFYITRNSVNVPYYDEWAWGDLLGILHSGKLEFRHLSGFHDEHRPIVARLVFLLITILAGRWDILNELYANVLCGIASLFALWRMLKITTGRALAPWTLAVMSALFFSTSHSVNWLMGFQLMWLLTATFLILVLWLLTEFNGQLAGLLFAVICGVCATFNIASGMAVWPLGLLLMLALRQPANGKVWKIWHVFIWLMASGVVIALYFSGYIRAAPNVQPARALEMAKFVLTYLGGPLALGQNNSLVITAGAVGLAAYLACIALAVHKSVSRIVPWAMLGGFSLMSAVLTSVGRLNYGVEYANAAHYVFIATLFWISLTGLVASLIEIRRENILTWPRPIKIGSALVSTAVLLAFLSSYVNVYDYGLKQMGGLRQKMMIARDYLLADHASIPNAVLLLIHWDPDLARSEIQNLADLKEGVFLTDQDEMRVFADLAMRQKPSGIALATSAGQINFTETSALTVRGATSKIANEGASLIVDPGAAQQAEVVLSLDDAPQNGKPFYFVIQTRFATSIDISWGTGDKVDEKNAQKAIPPSYVRGNDRRYAINMPAGSRRVLVTLHYNTKPTEPDILRMAIVAAQL